LLHGFIVSTFFPQALEKAALFRVDIKIIGLRSELASEVSTIVMWQRGRANVAMIPIRIVSQVRAITIIDDAGMGRHPSLQV